MKSLQEKIEESNFRCGDTVDILDVFVVKKTLQCGDDIESMYHSGLVDGTPNAPLICYACGDTLSTDILETYIEGGVFFLEVYPTTLDQSGWTMLCASYEHESMCV